MPGRPFVLFALCALLLPGLFAAHPAQAASEDLWRALAQGGHVALMRHARAPGTGDPANFKLGDCTTQRNLDAGGRAQARRAGALFRRHGVTNVRVSSSQWCRCRETAELLGLGPVQPLPILNSLFGRQDAAASQTAALRQFIAGVGPAEPSRVLVTHQTNIRSLVGVATASGAIVVVRPEGAGFKLLDTIPAP